MPENKRYYWLKLKRDFFKRHDIQIIEAMPNGKDYVLFYLKLLVESVDHDGSLRFSDTIPYNEEMLSTITNTNIDTVRTAMKILESLHLVEVLDDQTIYMEETQKMVGSESWSAQRMRKLRQNESKSLPRHIVQKSDSHVTSCDEEKELEKDTDIEKDIPPISPQKRNERSNIDSRFSAFWKAYPRKAGKGAAEKAFKKYKPDDDLLSAMLKAIQRQLDSTQWKESGGQFIPYPATWLNQRRWEDETPQKTGKDEYLE